MDKTLIFYCFFIEGSLKYSYVFVLSDYTMKLKHLVSSDCLKKAFLSDTFFRPYQTFSESDAFHTYCNVQVAARLILLKNRLRDRDEDVVSGPAK